MNPSSEIQYTCIMVTTLKQQGQGETFVAGIQGSDFLVFYSNIVLINYTIIIIICDNCQLESLNAHRTARDYNPSQWYQSILPLS